MRNVSSAFMRALAEDKRDWICTATITLVQNIYSYPKVKKDMRYRISGTYTSVSLDGVAITVTEGYFTAPDDGVLTITGGTSSGDTPTVIRQILDIDNSHIWENGFKIDDAVSADNLFEIGGAIINQATLVLNNIYDEFTEYDFFGANVVMYIGLEVGDTVEYIKMGTFLVDDPKYNSSLLTLTCLDYMSLFDKPSHYNGGNGGDTLFGLVNTACERCGVVLATPNFQNRDIHVRVSLTSTMTYRQIVSWAAQAAGCYARVNVNGELELKFYDFDALEGITENSLDGGVFDEGSEYYASGDSADGGSFNPWDTGDVYDGGSFTNMPNVHIISSDYSHNMSMDDIVITGVRVVEKVDNLAHRFASDFRRSQNYAVGDRCCYNNDLYECISAVTAGSDFDESDWKKLPVVEYMYGTEGYVISIEGNEVVHGWQNDTERTPTGQEVANRLGYLLVGRKFRQASISHPSDPTIEAGDVALFIDRKGYQYPIVVSSTTFSNGDAQNTTSSAQTPQNNSSQRYSASTKNYVAMREQLSGETAYIENTINDKIANAGGLYETYTTNVKTGEGMIWHLHDKQNLAESNIVMMFSDVGFTLTSNYQDTTPTWYGMTVDGDMISRILYTTGVDADWIDTGTILVEDEYGNETFYADYETGEVRINAQSFSLSGAQITSSWSGDGIPTNSNYPASSWTTPTLKEKHLDDIYYDETGGTGIYKYTKACHGFAVRFTGSYYGYNHLYDTEVIVAFKYADKWYKFVNPFPYSNEVDVVLFIPTEYTYSKDGVTYPALNMYIHQFVGMSLSYEISFMDAMFPEDAILHGTSAPFSTSSFAKRMLSLSYSISRTSGYANESSTTWYVDTPLFSTVAYIWENIGISNDDEYARTLAQQASDNASAAVSTANSASSAVTTLDANLYGQNVLNRLTNNGNIQGMWMENNRLYISFTSARGGTLTLGGQIDPETGEPVDGVFKVRNANNEVVVSIDNEKAMFIDPDEDEYFIIEDGMINYRYDYASSWGPIMSMGIDDISSYPDDVTWDCNSDRTFVINQDNSTYSIILRGTGTLSSRRAGIEVTGTHVNLNGSIYINGQARVTSGKGRLVKDTAYGDRILYCYETPTPYFGDIGTGKTDENGEAFISIDDIFDETVNTNVEYSVFLQKEGQGDLWVDEKNHSFFVVKGTPNLKFSWELKAVQRGFEKNRLEDDALNKADEIPMDDLDRLLDEELDEFDKELEVL